MTIARALPYVDQLGSEIVQNFGNENGEFEIAGSVPDGSEAEPGLPVTNPDGTTSVTDFHGTTTRNTDGTFTTRHRDGRTVYRGRDGVVTRTEHPDGRITTPNGDGTSSTRHPDGRVTTPNRDGTITTKHPDGSRVQEDLYAEPGYSTRGPDGSITTVNDDRTTTTRHPDGSITQRYRDGTIKRLNSDESTTDGNQPSSLQKAGAVGVGAAAGFMTNTGNIINRIIDTVGRVGNGYCAISGGCR